MGEEIKQEKVRAIKIWCGDDSKFSSARSRHIQEKIPSKHLQV